MQMYIGTKIIDAEPMTLGEYSKYRGWDMPENENANSDGMLVEYQDGGKPNHPKHENYISWSPENVFADAYKNVRLGMPYGSAVVMMKLGFKVARIGWNGKNMWVILVPGTTGAIMDDRSPYAKAGLSGCDISPHFDLMTRLTEICNQDGILLPLTH